MDEKLQKQQRKPVVTKESAANKRPSQRQLPTTTAAATSTNAGLKQNLHLKAVVHEQRDDSPSSTHVNVSSSSDGDSVSPPPGTMEAASAEAASSRKQQTMRRDTRDMVSPVSTPNMSDISDNEMEDNNNELRLPSLASSRVKRSESDGIVVADRPKPEKVSVRRCESIDDATSDRLGPIEEVPSEPITFPQNIKTVAPATIVKGPEDATHSIGETVHFLAHYFGNPEPRVIWIKNGQRLASSEDGRLSIKTYSGESTLIVKDLRGDDSGKYEVQIENEVGTDAASASLSVEGPPEPPAGRPYVSHIDAETSSLTLAWYGSTFDGGSMVTGYVVEMSCWPITSGSQPPDASDWTVLNAESQHSTSFVVRGLKKDEEYIFRVKAVNVHGQSEPSRVSEPVSLASNQHSGSSGNEDNCDEEANEDGCEKTDHDHENDPESFEAPFEHKIVTVEDGSIFKAKFEIYEELGRGRFGVVFKVKDKVNGEVLAAKFVRCRKSEEKQKCQDEIAIMNVLDSKQLLQLAVAYENPREIIMVMEYIGGGELFEKVVADDFTLTERDCVLFMRQICEAVGYMHDKYIVHLDLKPENILCKSKNSHLIKIIDFGLTKKLKRGEDVRILFGTPEFVSPEVISYEPVSTTSDMWSVGVICYVLLSGLSPFMGDSDVETFNNISGIAYDFDDEAFDNISDEAKNFISKLLVKFQNKRMTAYDCLQHSWLLTGEMSGRKEINTDKLKSFMMRRRWQKAAHAIRALGRFTSLGFRNDPKDGASSITALSTQSADF
jgi:predicted Ser/Thr protein kinase